MEIRPKNFGDALNEWFRSMGRNWKPLLFSSLAIHIPLALVMTVVFWISGAGEAFGLYLEPETLDTLTEDEIIDTFTPFLWVMGVWTLLQLLGGVFVYLAAARTVGGDMSDAELDWVAVSRFAASRLATGVVAALVALVGAVVLVAIPTAIGWAAISSGGATFLTVFITATAALTALVVIMWLGVSLSFAAQAIAFEDEGPFAALVRSYSLVQGRWWVTLGFLLLASLIASAAAQVVSIALTPLFLVGAAVPEVLALAFGASALLQGPLLAATGAAYSIWYVDLWARRETVVADQLL